MFDRILIPTDGSEAVRRAIDTGLNIARTYGASVHTLYVVETRPPARYGAPPGGTVKLDVRLAQHGERATQRIADQAATTGIEVTTAVREGHPPGTILDYAEAHDIDLIVMGTHGRTGVTRVLIGSVTETVVRHSDIPVLTVGGLPESAARGRSLTDG